MLVRIILAVILFLSFAFVMQAQNIGSTETPYDTTGWDEPAEYTEHYNLPIYQLLSNPGGWINRSQSKVDSLLNALIVLTDYYQQVIRNDTLVFSDSLSGKGQFSGQDTSVTITMFDTFDSLDVVIAFPESHGADANLLSVYPTDGSFDVRRAPGGTADLKFNWIWIRKYQ